MMSLSASWFFVVASEAISVSNQNITLPGIGSYIHVALLARNGTAILWAILAMFLVIVLYDQLIFRPLLTWSDKFKVNIQPDDDVSYPWFLNWLQRSTLINRLNRLLVNLKMAIINFRWPTIRLPHFSKRFQSALDYTAGVAWHFFVFSLLFLSLAFLSYFIYKNLSGHEVVKVFGLGLITGFKVAVLILGATLIWVPIGVYIGLNARLARFMQPIVQFCAAFPADVVYPVLMMLILTYHLNVDIFSSPLMILGTQWYILFNVIAGTQTLPQDLRLAAQSYGVKGWLWWKRLILPTIFPYYVTGAMAAAGGCWNASILADVITWGDTTVRARGLGGYIASATQSGDFPRIALGIGVMCILVIIINHLVWQRLYALSETYTQRDSSYD
jgi:NitT/TauT family transport system permease protein